MKFKQILSLIVATLFVWTINGASLPVLAINDQKQNVCTCNCSTASPQPQILYGQVQQPNFLLTPNLPVYNTTVCSEESFKQLQEKYNREYKINQCLTMNETTQKSQCLRELRNSLP